MPNRLFDPLTRAPSRAAGRLADYIDDPNAADRSPVRGFLAGALQGAGDLASDMTSPASLATMGLGPTAGLLGKLIGRGARGAGRGIAAGAEMLPQFGPKAWTVGADEAAGMAARRAQQAKEIATRRAMLRDLGETDYPSQAEVAEMMARRKR